RKGKTSGAGGAIFCEENLTLIRDVIDDNRAERVGAVVAGGNLTIKKSLITGNRSLTNVGAVYFYGIASPTASFTLTVKGSPISGNTTVNGSGGGLFLYGGYASVTNSVISGNTASNYGGGVYASPQVKALTVSGCTVSGNRATNESNSFGGGILRNAAETTIARPTLTRHSAGVFGGGVGCAGAVTISRSRFTDNTAQNGGGLRVFSGGDFQTSLTMTDCVVSGNHADGGRIVTGAGGGLSASVSAPSSVSGCT